MKKNVRHFSTLGSKPRLEIVADLHSGKPFLVHSFPLFSVVFPGKGFPLAWISTYFYISLLTIQLPK